MSALQQHTILFLFWSITHLRETPFETRWRTNPRSNSCNPGCRSNSALAYTFTDSFWFIAVEAEAYHLLNVHGFLFLAILKWENVANEPHSNRWLILIAYMRLSIGVHLLTC